MAPRKKKAANEIAKRDLELFVDNDKVSNDAMHNAEVAVAGVICRKKTFDVDLAARVFERALQVGVKRYEKEFATPGSGMRMFDKPTRDELAKERATDFKSRVNDFLREESVARDADMYRTPEMDTKAKLIREKMHADLTPDVIKKLVTCKATPFAGRRQVRRRRRR